jgi:chromosome segregation ATPase
MASNIIQDILNNGKAINNELGKKIELLNQKNSKFNGDLTKRLNDIISSISSFKNTNLSGLTETKNKLSSVTKELETTKMNLQQTQNELENVKTALSSTQNELQTSNSKRNELEQQNRDITNKITQLQTEYDNKIYGIKDEMSKKSTEEKKQMTQEFNNKMEELNSEKINLQKAIEDAQQKQTEAVNNLAILQKEQDGLINNLSTINDFLTKQLELISNINTEQPNIDEYNGLLETIQNGLGGVINEINQAVLPSSQTPSSSSSQTPLYDKFIKLSEQQKQQVLSQMERQYVNTILTNIQNPTPENKMNINNIISRHYNGNLLRGGKKSKNSKNTKQKTNKLNKKHKTKKHLRRQKGGYTYSSSKELDKASSIVSASSNTKSPKSNKKYKTKTYKSMN